MRVDRDGTIRVGGRGVRVIPAAVADRLASASRWLSAAGQESAAELGHGDVRPGGRPGTATIGRSAEERILRAADAAWVAAGHGAMPAPWRSAELVAAVRRVLGAVGGQLGRWGDELRWWLAPHDRVTDAHAAKIAAVLAAVERAEERIVSAAAAARGARERWEQRRAAARRAAIAAVGPEPVPTPEEREAIRAGVSPVVVPSRDGWERRVQVGLRDAWVMWEGGRWIAHNYTTERQTEVLSASVSEDSRGDGVGGPVGGGLIDYGREVSYVVHVGAPLPDDQQAAFGEAAEELYRRSVRMATETNELAARQRALADGYRRRVDEYRRACERAAEDAERGVAAEQVQGALDVLLSEAGVER